MWSKVCVFHKTVDCIEQSGLMIKTKIKLRIKKGKKADLSSQMEPRVFIRIREPQLFTVCRLCESLTSLCRPPAVLTRLTLPRHGHLHPNTMTSSFLRSSWMYLRGCQRQYVCFWALNSTLLISSHVTCSSLYHFCVSQMLLLTLQDRRSCEYKRIKNYK